MTLDEIRGLVDALLSETWEAQLSGRTFGESKSVAKLRASLLQAVEGIVRERDRAESALVARHGGEPLTLLAELDEARARAEAAEHERDEAKARVPDPERIAQLQRIADGHAATPETGVCWDCQVGGPAAGPCSRHAAPPRRDPSSRWEWQPLTKEYWCRECRSYVVKVDRCNCAVDPMNPTRRSDP